tara:strand:+ start:4049 stop:4459 length:411 start_codon:yes stop_codon:yes gene_type:complete
MNYKKLRENPETANVGKKWSDEDLQNLNQYIDNDNFDYDFIATQLKRTSGSIRSKVFHIYIYPEFTNGDGISITNLSSKYNIDKDILEQYLKKQENNIQLQSSKKSKPEKLDEINERLDTIEEKLDWIIQALRKKK